MVDIEKELIDIACGNLTRTLDKCDIRVGQSGHTTFDSVISIAGIEFAVIVKSTLTNTNLLRAIEQARIVTGETGFPVLFVLGYIAPTTARTLVENGFNYIDYSGNCTIRQGLMCITVSGLKNHYLEQKKSHIMSEAKIHLILCFLSNPHLIGEGYRAISSETGYSLGTIKNTIEDLTAGKYVLHTDKGRKLINKEDLLNQWVQAYNQIARPKLTLRKMRFRSDEMKKDWKQMKLPQGMVWGGDCGANLIDGYLIPGSYEIYTSEPSAALLATGRVLPDDNGEITVYKKFWTDSADTVTAGKLIIYADLVNGGDSRQLEAAQRLISDGI